MNKGWERHVNEIVILEKDLDLLNENEVSLFEEIQEAISGVFDSKLRQVLKMRHINLMGFREISEKIHYSRQYVYKLYRKALLKFMIP